MRESSLRSSGIAKPARSWQLGAIALLGAGAASLFAFRSIDSRRAAAEHVQRAPRVAPPQAVESDSAVKLAPTVAEPATIATEENGASAEPAAPAVQALPAEPTAQDSIDRARAEPRDDAWADAMERTFGEDLQAKAQRLNIRVGRVECFEASCTAELFWSTLREARANFKGALGGPDHTQCSPQLLLSEHGNEDAPEMGIVVLDCKAARERAAIRAGTKHPD